MATLHEIELRLKSVRNIEKIAKVQLSPPSPAFPYDDDGHRQPQACQHQWNVRLFYFIYYSFFSNTPTRCSHLALPDHLQSQLGPTVVVAATSPSPSPSS